MAAPVFPVRRPVSHRKIVPMPVWQAVCLSVIAAGVLSMFLLGVVVVVALVVVL